LKIARKTGNKKRVLFDEVKRSDSEYLCPNSDLGDVNVVSRVGGGLMRADEWMREHRR
jgi:anaerobic ribonucleoside-triphosphate reductase